MVKQKLNIRRKVAAVAKWKASGLSQAEFCRVEGLQQRQLSAWKGVVAKLGEQEEKDPAESHATKAANTAIKIGRRSRAKLENQRQHKLAEVAAGSQNFVPAHLVGEVEDQGNKVTSDGIDFVLEVVLRRGHVVRVAPGCKPEFLGAVVSTLDF